MSSTARYDDRLLRNELSIMQVSPTQGPEEHYSATPEATWCSCSLANSPSTFPSYAYGTVEAGATRPTSSRLEGATLLTELSAGSMQAKSHHTLTGVPKSAQEPIATLDAKRLVIFRSCGNNPHIQKYVLDILQSPAYQRNEPLLWASVEPLLQAVKYDQVINGKGKRGGPMHYRCLWGECDQIISRRGHALEHIQVHAGNRPFVCSVCGSSFVRKNELQRHQPCRKPCQNFDDNNYYEPDNQIQCARPDSFPDPRNRNLESNMFFGVRFH
ncbi:hypothetical protein FRC18_009376 [Serendipita sp. 400]|nr:hypothetical protein FRC18_009376 [Serendipita sp. 400]